jgi:NodT family efflux transporter outer membrane factor (OMF) lipoprotein
MKHALVTLASVLAVSACTVGPDFQAPPAPAISGYATSGDAALPADQQIALGAKVEGDWWTAFQSPALNDTVALALSGNQTVEAARARMAQAEEDVNAAEGALLPQVALDATAGRQKYGKALFGPLNFKIPPFTYYEVGPAVTFPLDLFGGQKRTVEEKQALVDYQRFELDATYQSLTAHVAAEALAVASAKAQADTINAIIADDQRDVDLVQRAINGGSGTRVQLVSAQSQLASDRTLIPDLDQQGATARHALAVLVGKAPAEWSPPQFALADFTLPAEIPASLPSELVHRRPDILAAEAQLHVASAAIGVATANLYPKIDLTGAITQQALTPAALFNSVSNAWAVAANLAQPIFNGGQLKAQRQAAIDNYRAALATYRGTILTAFGEVADRLQALSTDAARLKAQAEAGDTAAQSYDLAQRSYMAGNSGVLDVIEAERRNAEAQLGLTRAKAQRLIDTVQLYLALGGSPLNAAETTASREANAGAP